MSFKGLNLETVFLQIKKPLKAISNNYFNEICHKQMTQANDFIKI